MPITFQCSHCQSKMTVPDTLAGKKGKCSKCQKPVAVPAAANGAAAKAPPPKPPAPNAAAPVPPPPVPIDVEAAAAELFSDAPKGEEQSLDAVEFTCPQCDEPIKVPLELAGKRAPCPSCSRVIPVPVPQKHREKNWRDTGPKMPAAAKRDVGPELEGAWGTDKATGLSQEAAEEAGLIPEKDRPLTFYQRYQTHLLVGVPLLLVLVAGYYGWGWYAAGREARAYAAAVAFASGEGVKKAGPVAVAGLHSEAGVYQSRTKPDGSALRAKEQFAAALGLLRDRSGPTADALLIDLARRTLTLGGEAEDIDRGARLKWDEVHKLARQALTEIDSPDARLAGLRLVAADLIKKGHAGRALMLASQVAAADAERGELTAAVGLELLRGGKREQAVKAAEEAEALYPPLPKDKDKDKGKTKAKPRPPLRPGVVALAVALGRREPEATRNVAETDALVYGRSAGLAAAGKLDDARRAAGQARGTEANLLARIALLAASEKPAADDVADALKALQAARDRRGLDWELLRLLAAALAAEAKTEDIDAIIAAIPTAALRKWGMLMALRDRAARTRYAIPVADAEKLSAQSAAGLLARLEAARQNAWADAGWAGTVGGWDEVPRAFGSLGVALGLQGGREGR